MSSIRPAPMTPLPSALARSQRVLLAAVSASVAIAASASPAGASHDDGPGALGERDDNTHYVVPVSLEADGFIACVQGQAQLNDQTEITSVYNEGGNDVSCVDAYWGGGDGMWRGEAECMAFHASGRCDRFDARFNLSKSTDDSHWKDIGCHELGHTASVGHRKSPHNSAGAPPGLSDDADENSCMNWKWDGHAGHQYDPHDIDAIDASFP